jgi:hypothetical protein
VLIIVTLENAAGFLNGVPDVSERLVRNQDGSRFRFVLQTGREVHGTSDNGVIHPILAAEIADGAVVAVNADTASKWRLNARVPR